MIDNNSCCSQYWCNKLYSKCCLFYHNVSHWHSAHSFSLMVGKCLTQTPVEKGVTISPADGVFYCPSVLWTLSIHSVSVWAGRRSGDTLTTQWGPPQVSSPSCFALCCSPTLAFSSFDYSNVTPMLLCVDITCSHKFMVMVVSGC